MAWVIWLLQQLIYSLYLLCKLTCEHPINQKVCFSVKSQGKKRIFLLLMNKTAICISFIGPFFFFAFSTFRNEFLYFIVQWDGKQFVFSITRREPGTCWTMKNVGWMVCVIMDERYNGIKVVLLFPLWLLKENYIPHRWYLYDRWDAEVV